MKITLKLFASLTDYLPREGRDGNIAQIDVGSNTTVGQVIDAYALPHKHVHLVLVNGSYIVPEQRAGHTLKEDDALAIWPPIAGG